MAGPLHKLPLSLYHGPLIGKLTTCITVPSRMLPLTLQYDHLCYKQANTLMWMSALFTVVVLGFALAIDCASLTW